jgi:hypothetical protein
MESINFQFFAIALGIVSLVLFVLTVSNRVTFFSSNTDFVLSFLSVFTLAFLVTFMPDYFSSWETLTTGQSIWAVLLTCVLSLLFLIFFFSSLYESISANGFWVGLIIFIYKLVVGTTLSIVILGKISEALDYKKQGTRNTFAAILVVTVIFKPFLGLLVNGERVKARKLSQE